MNLTIDKRLAVCKERLDGCRRAEIRRKLGEIVGFSEIEKVLDTCCFMSYDRIQMSNRRRPHLLRALFSSGLRAEILSHFFFHPGQSFHVRRLAAELGASAGTVGRELSRLERAALLASQPVGNQKHYRLRPDAPIIDDLRNIFLKVSGPGAELRSVLEKLPGVRIAFLYGSYVSGEAHAGSDLDLMIVGEVSDGKVAPRIAAIERRLRRQVNYSIYAPGEVEDRLEHEGDFVHEVFRGPRILLIGNPDDRLFRTGP